MASPKKLHPLLKTTKAILRDLERELLKRHIEWPLERCLKYFGASRATYFRELNKAMTSQGVELSTRLEFIKKG